VPGHAQLYPVPTREVAHIEVDRPTDAIRELVHPSGQPPVHPLVAGGADVAVQGIDLIAYSLGANRKAERPARGSRSVAEMPLIMIAIGNPSRPRGPRGPNRGQLGREFVPAAGDERVTYCERRRLGARACGRPGMRVLPVGSSFAVVEGEAMMARKKSLWSELQGERERRARIALAQERRQRQMQRQIEEDYERAERRAARADAAERKRQEQLAHEAGASAAGAMRAQLDAQVTQLRTLLISALERPPQLSFAMLKRPAVVPSFDPGDLGKPLPVPVWEAFAPPSPGALSGLVGGKGRHARAEQVAREALEQACAEHARAEDARVRELRAARERHDQQVQALEAEVREHNAAVDELESDFGAGVPDAVEDFFTQVLALSEYPSGFPHEYQIAYRQEPRELVIEYRLPGVEVIPAARDFRYVKTRGEIDELARPVKEVKELYASVIHQIALRTMWECLVLTA
jgi:hypothetical protein